MNECNLKKTISDRRNEVYVEIEKHKTEYIIV